MNIQQIESKLWSAANQLRGNMSAEEYMHVILGILSLKYISDKYDVAIKKLDEDGFSINDLSQEMFYAEYNAFKVSSKSHWNNIMKFASNNEVGEKMDEAFIELEKDNPMLSGIFNKNYNSEGIDQNRLGEVVKIFSGEDFTHSGEDIIGKIYEFFLNHFFKDRGQKGGEFYTPKTIVGLIVNLIKPLKGSIYDPACGTGGMLIQAKRFIEEHDGNIDEVSMYGQEYNNVTWKLAKLNLILNGFPLIDNNGDGVLGNKSADTFAVDQHSISKFDYIMANPPFNLKNWERKLDDPRWQWGTPPKGNANYGWLSHIVSKLSSKGKAGVVLANGSLSSSGKEELNIRKQLVDENKVDAIIALPDKLFYTVSIPACIWIFNNDKKTKDILMVDASKMTGKMLSKKLRELTTPEINKINSEYEKHQKGIKSEILEFSKSISKEELEQNNYSFVPGRYVGVEEVVIDIEAAKKEVEKISIELDELLEEFNNTLPSVKESIQKALNLKK
ncbi:type I restriction-modification system subunit M [Mycoplasma todarodis]|uniref:site-specific DNA-methyltransferase (adenine-specific) n=1 Tax=Mycoplasma todarodis TaxID=1937191 RepID=A0A4R0XVX3_9MOLU|nr:class I SAM-dependent DNA methyltransferase [Mycoplasma todarodis]TCG11946.1 DNA methyltransferase [Mycoplasma todarodis]